MALKILFADDSMTAQNMGKKILTDAGYEVIAVSNGAQALKKISELKPELIVLDVYMPGYTGLEVCEKVRAARETAKTPVLLTVGKMEPYKPEEGARVKADGVIVKPFEASDLLAAIQKLASQAKAAELKNVVKPPENQKTVLTDSPKNGAQSDANTAVVPEEPEMEVHSQSRAKPSVSIPTDMAGYAAFGFDEDLLPSQAAEAPAQSEVAQVPPSPASNAPESAVHDTKSAKPVQAKAADAIAAEFDISNGPVSSQPPSAQMHQTYQAMSAEAGEGKNDLLERFDAVLSSFEVAKVEGFEATAVDPAPGMPVSTEMGFEPTARVDQEAETVEIIPETGLDPFSRTHTDVGRPEPVMPASAPAPSSHVPVWEQTGEVSFAVPETLPESDAGTVTDFTASIEDEVAATAAVPEPAPAAEVDDFDARVNAAMSAFEAEGSGHVESETEVAPAIAEREQEEAELAASNNAIESELTGAPSMRESLDPPVEAIETSHSVTTWTYNDAAAPDPSASSYSSDSEIEHTPEPPAFTRAASASAGSSNELARAVASAVNPAIAGITTGAESNSSANSRALKPEVITRIVGQVLEKSLPDILSKVMSEIEKEQE